MTEAEFTEADWLDTSDQLALLRFLFRLGREPSDRQMRLAAVACARSIVGLESLDHCRHALAVAERIADAETSTDEVAEAAVQVQIRPERPPWNIRELAIAIAGFTLEPHPGTAWGGAYNYAAHLADEQAEGVKWERLGSLTHCIFGNPFRPVALDPEWRTSTVVQLARGIYDDRAFDRLPILADALQDAGCDNADVLNHCRQPGPHARGCWVVDLVLGKS